MREPFGTDNGNLVFDGKTVRKFQQPDPANIPWSEMDVDIVVECTGVFTDAAKAAAHIDSGGAKKVIISAPARGADATIVLGVNDEVYRGDEHRIISNASCTTNCFAPMVKVLHDAFGIERGLMSTIHAYTNDQSILDRNHRDLRRARAAAQNIVPTSTGAARSVGVVLPELEGKLHGIAYRIPTSVGSVTDFVADLKQNVTKDDINAAFKTAADGSLKGILEYTEDPIVSSDIRGNTHSCIFDGLRHHGAGRQHGQGYGLVRQRVGLFLPHRRPVLHGGRIGRTDRGNRIERAPVPHTWPPASFVGGQFFAGGAAGGCAGVAPLRDRLGRRPRFPSR